MSRIQSSLPSTIVSLEKKLVWLEIVVEIVYSVCEWFIHLHCSFSLVFDLCHLTFALDMVICSTSSWWHGDLVLGSGFMLVLHMSEYLGVLLAFMPDLCISKHDMYALNLELWINFQLQNLFLSPQYHDS